jgi:FAD/FMN-containing dehydrogenase
MPFARGVAYALVDIVGQDNAFFPHTDSTSDHQPCATVWGATPDAVVYPGDARELAEIVRGAAACDVTVRLPCGTALHEGSAGEILLAMTRLNQILQSADSCEMCCCRPWRSPG